MNGNKWIVGVLALVLLVSCSQEQSDADFRLQVDMAKLSKDYVILGRGLDRDTVSVDSAGSAIVELQMDGPEYISLRTPASGLWLYVAPGENLEVKGDASDLVSSVQFGGSLAEENRVRTALAELKKEQMQSFRQSCRLPLDSFQMQLKTWLDERMALIPDSGVAPELVSWERERITLDKTALLIRYNSYYPYFSGDQDYETPEAITSHVAGFDLGRADLLGLSDYPEVVGSVLDFYLSLDTTEFTSQAEVTHAKLGYCDQKIANDSVRDRAKYDVLSSHVRYAGVEDMETALPDFYARTAPQYKNKLEELAQPWEALAAGNPAPDLELHTLDGETAHLSDFKGRYVYVDFWATWCGPCKAEIPHLEKMQETLKDANVAFVSISVDNTKEPWLQMVEEKDLKGTQLHEGSSADQIKSEYLVYSIPRFVIIDPEGKIVDAQAPRPSGDATEVLQQLLTNHKTS